MAKESSAKTPRRSPRVGSEKVREMIGRKAYELFEKRGREHGHDVDDWLEAEKFVKTRKKG
ncbi:MAG: DUF2934 domain-containing protein [Thermodesulfobacteriota bacterium]